MKISYVLAPALLATSVLAFAQMETIPPGTRIPIRTNEYIDVRNGNDSRSCAGGSCEPSPSKTSLAM